MTSCSRLFFFIAALLLSLNAPAQYFQQDVRYVIHVALDDRNHVLNADETIFYKNNSPSTLAEIYINLWPAAYKNETTPLARQYYDAGDNRFLIAKERSLGDIDSLNFMINGIKAEWKLLNSHPDVCRIKLGEPLGPGDSLMITTPFRVNIPASYLSRLGHSRQAYYITQWFPKPAVFDKNGWNYFSYLDKGEFYGEFGTFDVFITLPSNYKVAATGIVQDSFEREWLNMQDSITKTITSYPAADSIPASSAENKTVHFHQDNVHDFAWFADKRWNYLSDTLKLASGRIIKINSFFNNSHSVNWKKANAIMKNAINHYSSLVGEYPYDAMTAVDVGEADGAGMEYPMITAIGSRGNSFYFETTLVHEVGHNWFYGALGNNERCNGWMDEGVNKYYENLYIKKISPAFSSRAFLMLPRRKFIRPSEWSFQSNDKLIFNYLTWARTNRDQPPNLCAQNYNLRYYNSAIYYKPAIGLNYLHSYLGDSLFNKCMQSYFNEWKFRHPSPDDMQKVFESTSGRELGWLFDDFLAGTKKLDYAVTGMKKTDGGYLAEITNKKQIAAPVELSTVNGDTVHTQWVDGFTGKREFAIPAETRRISINRTGEMPELYVTNDAMRTHGMFRKCKPVKFSFGTSIDKRDTTQIYYSPVVAWNAYDGVMAGIVLHNISFLEKKFEYRLLPMYAFKSKSFAGGGDVAYHFYPHGRINRVTVRTGLSHYSYLDDLYEAPNDGFIYTSTLNYSKIDSRVILDVKSSAGNRELYNQLTIRDVYIERGIPYEYFFEPRKTHVNYFQVEYVHQNKNLLERGIDRLTITGNKDLLQFSGEIKKFFNYSTVKKGFEARFFGGYTARYKINGFGMEHRMNMSGRRGVDDYLFDEPFFARTDNNSIQFVTDYAGFKSPTNFYRLAQEYMFGANLSTTLPGFIPFRLFASIATMDNMELGNFNDKFSWEAGIDLPVIRDIFIISLPFAYSEDIKTILKAEGDNGFGALRFELHLKLLNPLDKIKNQYQ